MPDLKQQAEKMRAALELIANTSAMDYEYRRWARMALIEDDAARRQHGSAAQAVEPKRRDIFAICDAYESGIGHGLQRDGHKSGAIFGNPECGMAYEIGYEEGEERSSWKKPAAPPVADAEGAEDVKDLAQARRLITQLRAALSRLNGEKK